MASAESLAVREIAVLVSALIYWGGAAVQARRVRKRIGRSPSLKPGNVKERLLSFAWVLVVAGWFAQPIILLTAGEIGPMTFISGLLRPAGVWMGMCLVLGGTLVTFWSFITLGDAWRVWVDRKQTMLITHGPYRFARHPIYLSQIVVLLGTAILLPTLFSFALLLLHAVCVFIKIVEEEAYLSSLRAQEDRDPVPHVNAHR